MQTTLLNIFIKDHVHACITNHVTPDRQLQQDTIKLDKG